MECFVSAPRRCDNLSFVEHKPMIDVNLMSYIVWHHSIVTLQKIEIGQKVNGLLHLMFTSQLKEIKKTLNVVLNGSQGGHKNAYCDIETWMWMLWT